MTNPTTRVGRAAGPITAIALALALAASGVSAQGTTEDQVLVPDDAGPSQYFGAAVAIDAGLIAITAERDSEFVQNAGAVYLLDAATGAQLDKLVAADASANDFLGNAVALDGGQLAVGARFSDPNGSSSGSVYIFDTATGTQTLKFFPADGDSSDQFGSSVDIENGIVVAGAPGDEDPNAFNGSAYVFDANTGAQLFRLTADDEDQVLGGSFGFSVAIGDGIIAVGAPDFDTNLQNAGAVFVFDATTGEEIARLEPADGERLDQFGRQVAIDDGLLAVAAPFRNDGRGIVYIYDTENIAFQRTIAVEDAEEEEEMGKSLSLHAGTLVAGAPGEATNGFAAGAAYVFDATTGDLLDTLRPSDGESNDEFGLAVAVDGGTVVAGVDTDDLNGTFSGSAYLFGQSGGGPCNNADLAEPTGVLDLADISAFIAGFGAQTDAADLNDDGVWDLDDISAFITEFAAGCP